MRRIRPHSGHFLLKQEANPSIPAQLSSIIDTAAIVGGDPNLVTKRPFEIPEPSLHLGVCAVALSVGGEGCHRPSRGLAHLRQLSEPGLARRVIVSGRGR